MSKFVSPEPDENALVADAEKLVAQRTLINLPNLGICAKGPNVIIDQADFEVNGIDGSEPVHLLIRIVKGSEVSDEQAVAGFGEYVNVGQTLNMLAEASSTRQGAIQMIENENNQIGKVYHPGEAADQVNNTPGVWDAADVAFEEAWTKAGKNA